MKLLFLLLLLGGCVFNQRRFDPVELNGQWYAEKRCHDGGISARCFDDVGVK